MPTLIHYVDLVNRCFASVVLVPSSHGGRSISVALIGLRQCAGLAARSPSSDLLIGIAIAYR